MAKYNLTGALETKFTFSINDKEFEFSKPTVREMRGIAKAFGRIDKEENPEKQAELGDEAMAELYKFIVPVGHEDNIADVMQDQTVDVQKEFSNMIKTEFGLE